MKRMLGVLGAVGSIGVGLIVVTAQPAAAAVTVTTSGTTVSVDLVGNEGMDIFCTNSVVTIRNQTGSPAVPCTAVTKVVVTGDVGIQTVDGDDLDDPAFTAKPHLEVDLGAGDDNVTESAQADVLDLGPGTDDLDVRPSVPNTSVTMGSGTDTAHFFGFETDETIKATSTSKTLTFVHTIGGVTKTMKVDDAEKIDINGRAGNDAIDVSGVTAASSIVSAYVWGGYGDDVIKGAQVASTLFGSTGTNHLTGGPANDYFGSDSDTDVIALGGGVDSVLDSVSLHTGRTIDDAGFGHRYDNVLPMGDSVARVRPYGSGGTRLTVSLTRSGQQSLPSTFSKVYVDRGQTGQQGDRGLFDVQALAGNRTVYTSGDQADDDLADITIPYGSWTTTGTAAATLVIDPTDSILGTITLADVGDYRIHGPWTDKDKGFVHRVTRDLVFRFPTDLTISTVGAQLAGGTTTRAKVVSGLMDTDEYRGLDVDRTFIQYLDRKPDPGGRTYWINSIGNGKALWRFRAQLFGSNEYFTKAGATNEDYLKKVYGDVLGRAPDPSGTAYWTAKLDAGADRGSVALQFINANEFRRRLVDDQFLRFLDRYPTAGEQSTWVGKLASSTTGEQELVAFLAGSGAYYDRS